MLRPHDYFFDGFSLRNTHDVASASFVKNSSNFTVVAPMRHPFVNTRVYLDYHVSSGLIFIEELAKPEFAMLSMSFCQKTTGTRTKTLRFPHFNNFLIIHSYAQNVEVERLRFVLEKLRDIRHCSSIIPIDKFLNVESSLAA